MEENNFYTFLLQRNNKAQLYWGELMDTVNYQLFPVPLSHRGNAAVVHSDSFLIGLSILLLSFLCAILIILLFSFGLFQHNLLDILQGRSRREFKKRILGFLDLTQQTNEQPLLLVGRLLMQRSGWNAQFYK